METLLLSLALIIVGFCFYMDNAKLRKTIDANRGLSDQSLLAAQQALNELRGNMYSHSDALCKSLAQQISDLGRTCGQEDGKLHNMALTTTEEIEGLKAALASEIDARFDSIVNVQARDAQTRAELVSLKREIDSWTNHTDQEKPKKTLKKSRK
jgi:hypothetical protein